MCPQLHPEYRGEQFSNLSNIIVVGANDRSLALAREITENPKLKVNLLGFVDDMNWITDRPSLGSLNIIGDLEDIQEILEQSVVDQVFVTLPMRSCYSRIQRLVEICETIGVGVNIMPDLFSLNSARMTIGKLNGIPHFSYCSFPVSRWKRALKRVIDVVVSSILLILFSPLFLVISVLIKLTSKGPVLFNQKRAGYHNRVFTMLKFRSMLEGAEELRADLEYRNEMDGPVFKIREDPRVTRLGRFLRRSSIDELPQLINVLKGDMSLVGPRPPVPEEVEQYDPWQRRRLSVKPGLTCFWQVSGRNRIPFQEWMKLDLKYVDNWSLGLDMILLLKTIRAILEGPGAC